MNPTSANRTPVMHRTRAARGLIGGVTLSLLLVLAAPALGGVAGGIVGVVFHDRNADGTMDPEDEGIANVTVTAETLFIVDGAHVEGVISRTTGAAGDYLFDTLSPGATYRIRQQVPAGYHQTTPDPPDIVVPQSGLVPTSFGDALGGTEVPAPHTGGMVVLAGVLALAALAALRGRLRRV